jgi:phage terminase large subunit-like protein
VSFKLTAKQKEAMAYVAGMATHVMLFGGSRSGKTFLHVRNVVFRALKAPRSRHCILRFRFNHIKSSIIFDTFPKVMEVAFPEVKWKLNKSDWFVTINPDTDQASEIWFGGLDDKERTEKILGNEYATIYLNECSQIPWNGRNMVVTRLAQLAMTLIKGRDSVQLKPRMFYDCNPPNKSHWTYLVFVKKVDPESKLPLPKPDDFASFQMNPQDNVENLSDGYLDTLQSLSPRLRKRFLDGNFADANPNALFTDENIDKWRVLDGVVPDMVRIVVAVDPSGADDSDNADNDAIGIVVAGLGTDGNAYLLEDCTVKAGPATWGRVVTSAFDRHEADIVVGEINYGGAMVRQVIQTSRPRTPFLAVTASRGKAVRAEPISALYEEGKVRHVGVFRELEDELTAFSTVGYLGDVSPNRGDALVWALTALFPGIVKKETKNTVVTSVPTINHFNRS